MIVTLSNTTLYPRRPLVVAPKAQNPALSGHLNHTREVTCSNSKCRSPVRLVNGCWKRRAYPVTNYEGLWEDPDDASDDSEYDETDEDDDEENDLDYESDLRANGNEKASVSNLEDLSRKNYEEDLVREVELMLSPEEKAILEQNEAPNLEKLSTAKWKPLHSFALAGHIKYMDSMLEKGYDIDLVDKDGLTSLHLAVIGKREAVISHLLRKGANPEAKDKVWQLINV
ncbi:Ankyrin repeat domain-containing protein EMB506-chloroplastic [Striga hermonthica]|uniref:Ankyrin repeat domain-containing protein EMB506-chloroplastic n=1 Tax=Striga hermonthica TaxID=68872 RepID=A0A9N7N726_STRHE|nr:Ankyrin repeat domain-containing protein EMB506-chloroplastic [Striga hermonthica]